MSLLKSIYAGFVGGLLGLILCHCALLRGISHHAGYFLANFMIYSLLGYCYFHFVGLGETARRIRLLMEFLDAAEGLSYVELLNRYNSRDIVRVRMQRLLANGQIILRGGKLYIDKPVVLAMAKAIGTLKRMFFGNAKRV